MPPLLVIYRARNEVQRGLGPNELAPLGSVVFGQQGIGGNVVKFRIAVISIAIGGCELKSLVDLMDIFSGVESHRSQIEAFQNVQRLEHCGSLAPEAGLVDFVPAIID